MGNVIPMDQHLAAEDKKRAEADAKRDKLYRLKREIDANDLLLKRYQRKLREITECNATLLSANGDLMIRNEITRLQGEIEALNKKLEEVAKS